MFAVTVTFTLNLGKMAEFLPLMQQNAQSSVQNEPGCRQFDVCTDPTRPDQVFLYELYDDEAAFTAHTGMPHYKAFGASIDGMVADKEIRTFAQVAQ